MRRAPAVPRSMGDVDGSDARCDGRDGPRRKSGRKGEVIVQENQKRCSRALNAGVERRRQTPIRTQRKPNCAERPSYRLGVIGAAVVHDYHLDWRVLLCERCQAINKKARSVPVYDDCGERGARIHITHWALLPSESQADRSERPADGGSVGHGSALCPPGPARLAWMIALRPRRTRQGGGIVTETLLVLVLAAAAGWASGGNYLPYLNARAFIALAGAAVFVGILVVGLRSPMVPFAALLISFPLGDIARKLGTGDPRLILARDVLLISGTVLLAVHAHPWRDVITMCRPWLRPLRVFALWFGLAAVNAAVFTNPKVPLVGLRLYFGFLPLLACGWYVAQDRDRLRRAVIFGTILVCAATIVGIVQGVLGPRFLAGSTPNTDYFTHLDLLRSTAGQTAGLVFQPTGLFVEPGRFANWAFVNLAIGLALLPHKSIRLWRFVVPLVGALGLFAASNRTTIVAGLLLAVVVGLRQTRVDSARAARITVTILLLVSSLALLMKAFYPAQFEARIQFVGNSLNVTSSRAEGATRIPSYFRELASDIGKGGLIGRGAGTQGLGLKYLGANTRTSQLTEGGFASIMVETGVIGFLLWVYWTQRAWSVTRRYARELPGPFGQSALTLSTAIAVQLFVNFFIGINAIQDFVFNAWLFFVIGLVAGFATVARKRDAGSDVEPGERTIERGNLQIVRSSVPGLP